MKFGELRVVREDDTRYLAGFTDEGECIWKYDKSYCINIYDIDSNYIGVIDVYDNGHIGDLIVEPKYRHKKWGQLILEIAVTLFGANSTIMPLSDHYSKSIYLAMGFKIEKVKFEHFFLRLENGDFKPVFHIPYLMEPLKDESEITDYIFDLINKIKECEEE